MNSNRPSPATSMVISSPSLIPISMTSRLGYRTPRLLPHRVTRMISTTIAICGLSRARPIHNQESRHAIEFAHVGGDERRAAASRLAGDQTVVCANRRSLRFQGSADVSGVRRVLGSERRDGDASQQERFELTLG